MLVYQRVSGNIPTGAPEPLGISTALVISGTLLALTAVRAGAMERPVGGALGVAAMSSSRPLRSKSERNGDSLRFNGWTRLSEAFCIET